MKLWEIKLDVFFIAGLLKPTGDKNNSQYNVTLSRVCVDIVVYKSSTTLCVYVCVKCHYQQHKN